MLHPLPQECEPKYTSPFIKFPVCDTQLIAAESGQIGQPVRKSNGFCTSASCPLRTHPECLNSRELSAPEALGSAHGKSPLTVAFLVTPELHRAPEPPSGWSCTAASQGHVNATESASRQKGPAEDDLGLALSSTIRALTECQWLSFGQ